QLRSVHERRAQLALGEAAARKVVEVAERDQRTVAERVDARAQPVELLASLAWKQSQMHRDHGDRAAWRRDGADDRLARLAEPHGKIELAERLDRPAAQHDVTVVAVARGQRARGDVRPAEQLAEVRERIL